MDEKNDQQPVVQNLSGEEAKVDKQFEENRKKFLLLFNNDKKTMLSNKIPNDEVSGIIDELLEENREEVRVRLKTKGKDLIVEWAKYEKFIKEKDAEIAKARVEKKKEYNKKMQDFFNEIEDINKLAASMAASFTGGNTTSAANDETNTQA